MRRYIFLLEQSVIDCVDQFGVTADRSEHTGVWVGENKLCAIGIIKILLNSFKLYCDRHTN